MCFLTACAAAGAMVLSGCPSGGGSDGVVGGAAPPPLHAAQAQAPALPASAPRGLANTDGNSCFINAALQLVLASPELRAEVARNHPMRGFEGLFHHYDNPGATQGEINAARDLVAGYLRVQSNQPRGAGDARTVMETLLAHSHGGTVRYKQLVSNQMAVIDPALQVRLADALGQLTRQETAVLGVAGIGINGFEMLMHAGYLVSGNDASVHASPAEVARVKQPAADVRLQGFAFHRQGHFITYLRRGDDWYRANDSVVTLMAVADIDALLANTVNPGITLLSFERIAPSA